MRTTGTRTGPRGYTVSLSREIDKLTCAVETDHRKSFSAGLPFERPKSDFVTSVNMNTNKITARAATVEDVGIGWSTRLDNGRNELVTSESVIGGTKTRALHVSAVVELYRNSFV